MTPSGQSIDSMKYAESAFGPEESFARAIEAKLKEKNQ